MTADERPQKIVASQKTPRITLNMDVEIEGYRPEPKRLRTGEKTSERRFHVLVSDEEDKILAQEIRAHPKTPAAKSVPRVVSPRHA